MADRTREETERGARTAVKPGRRADAAGGRASATKPASRGATGSRTDQRGGGRAGPNGAGSRRTVPGRKQEIVALVLFGVAVFLIFVLIAGDRGGFVGRGVHAGLMLAFGRLAFLVPLTLLILVVTTVFEIKLRHSYWFAGALVFLFGLFMLVAAGIPPFGGHAEAGFVRADFEVRAGGLGEALFALFHRLVGNVGVGIIGWVTLLAGFSLATGVTVRRLGRGTKRAAQAVKATAGSTFGGGAAGFSPDRGRPRRQAAGPADDPYSTRLWPPVGPGRPGKRGTRGSTGDRWAAPHVGALRR